MKEPLVSIGVPVFNGGLTLRECLDSLLSQTFYDFELLISDNYSTDNTESICREYASKDFRIKYFRQSKNIGGSPNFKFILDHSKGKYFLLNGCDDIRSIDFLGENVSYLESHPECVASTSPNCFEGQQNDEVNFITFSITGNKDTRFKIFFENCWKSHAIFYSLIRKDILIDCPVVGSSFLASDWAMNLYLASLGNIHRVEKGLTIFGLNGVSNSTGFYARSRNYKFEAILPFYFFSRYALGLAESLTIHTKLYLIRKLFILNISAIYDQAISRMYQFYCSHLKYSRKIIP
jgi:glycosyltransferase involved in cell wall biosynthesis